MTWLAQTYLFMLYLGFTMLGVMVLFGGHHLHHNLHFGHHGFGHHLSILNVLLLITTVGALGTIGTLSVWPVAVAAGVAIVTGMGVAIVAGWYMEKMLTMQNTSQPDEDDLVGIPAVVTLTIPAGGTICGEVRTIIKDQIVTIRALPHIVADSFPIGSHVVTMDCFQGVVTVIRDASEN